MAKKSLGKNKTTLRMFIKSGSRLLMSDDAAGDGYSTVQRLTRVVKTTTQTAYRAVRLSSSVINKASGDAFKKLDAEVKQAIVRNTREHVINPVKKQINKGATQLNKKVVKPATTAAKKVGKQASTRITSTSAFTSARARINSTKAGFNRIKTKFSGSKIGKTTAKTGKTLAKGAKTTAKVGQKAAKAMTTVAAKIGETVASFISKVNKITLIIAAVIACIILLLLIITTVGHAMVGLLTGISDDTTNKDETYISKACDSIATLEEEWKTLLANSYNDKKAKDRGITGYNDLSKYTEEYYKSSLTAGTGSPSKYTIQSWGDKAPDASDYSTNAQLISNWNGDGYRVTPGINGSISNIKTILSVADYKQSIAVAVQSDNAAAGFNIFVKDFDGASDYEDYCDKVFKNTHFRYMSYSDLYTCAGNGYGCGDFLWYCNDTAQAHESLKKGSNIISYDNNDSNITDFKENNKWYCGTSKPNLYKCSGCQSMVCYDGVTRMCCPGHPYLGTAPNTLESAKKANPRGTFVSNTSNDDKIPNKATVLYDQKVSSFTEENNNWINTETAPVDVLNSYVFEGILQYNDNDYYFVVPLTSTQFIELKFKLQVYDPKTNDAIKNISEKLNANPEKVKKIKFNNILNENYVWTVTDHKYTIFSDNDRDYIKGSGIYGTIDNNTFKATIAPDIYTFESSQADSNNNAFATFGGDTYKPYHVLYNGTRTRCTTSGNVTYICKNAPNIKVALLYNNTYIYVDYYIPMTMYIPYSCPGCTYEISESHRIGYYTYCPGHTGTYCHGHTKLLVDGVTMYASDNINSDKLNDFTTDAWKDVKSLYGWADIIDDTIISDDVPVGFNIQLNGTSSTCTTNLWQILSGFESDYSDPRYPDFINWMYTSVESQGSTEYIIDNAPVIRQKEEDDWGTDYYGIDLSNNTYNRIISTSQFITNNVTITCPNGSEKELSKKFFSVDQLT